MNKTPLAQCLRVGLLDRGDQAWRPVGDDQQRAGQAPVLQVGQEACPGVGGLAAARGQADEGGLAAGGDTPGGQHRLGRGAGVHPEEARVQEQVIEGDLIEPAPCPRLVLLLDLLADGRHGGFGDRGLVAKRLGQGGFRVADRQAADEGGDHQGFQRVRLGHVRPEQPGGERPGGAAQLRPGQGDRPGSGLDRHLPVAVTAARPGVLAGAGPLVAVPAEELVTSASSAACISSCAPSRATSSRISGNGRSAANRSSMWLRIRSVGDTRNATGVGWHGWYPAPGTSPAGSPA